MAEPPALLELFQMNPNIAIDTLNELNFLDLYKFCSSSSETEPFCNLPSLWAERAQKYLGISTEQFARIEFGRSPFNRYVILASKDDEVPITELLPIGVIYNNVDAIRNALNSEGEHPDEFIIDQNVIAAIKHDNWTGVSKNSLWEYINEDLLNLLREGSESLDGVQLPERMSLYEFLLVMIRTATADDLRLRLLNYLPLDQMALLLYTETIRTHFNNLDSLTHILGMISGRFQSDEEIFLLYNELYPENIVDEAGILLNNTLILSQIAALQKPTLRTIPELSDIRGYNTTNPHMVLYYNLDRRPYYGFYVHQVGRPNTVYIYPRYAFYRAAAIRDQVPNFDQMYGNADMLFVEIPEIDNPEFYWFVISIGGAQIMTFEEAGDRIREIESTQPNLTRGVISIEPALGVTLMKSGQLAIRD